MDSETTQLSIRLPQDLRERIEKQAAAEERTPSQFIRFHLGRILDQQTPTENREAHLV